MEKYIFLKRRIRHLGVWMSITVSWQHSRPKRVRLHKVLQYVNLMHKLCCAMGMDYFQIVTEVHPSLDDSQEDAKSISNKTLERLAKKIHSLQAEKKKRVLKIKDLGTSMLDLWTLMDTPVEEQQVFQHVTSHISASEDENFGPSFLSVETIEEAQIEVGRLDLLKTSKMKELVLKKRLKTQQHHESLSCICFCHERDYRFIGKTCARKLSGNSQHGSFFTSLSFISADSIA